MAKNNIKIKTDLIGSFHTVQNKVELFLTNVKWHNTELFIIKTSILHKETNGKKGGIRYGSREQVASILKTYKNSVNEANRFILNFLIELLTGRAEKDAFRLEG